LLAKELPYIYLHLLRVEEIPSLLKLIVKIDAFRIYQSIYIWAYPLREIRRRSANECFRGEIAHQFDMDRFCNKAHENKDIRFNVTGICLLIMIGPPALSMPQCGNSFDTVTRLAGDEPIASDCVGLTLKHLL